MAVDYRKQYTPAQLEPFWPNEIVKMTVVVLCTLAVIMFLAVLPVLLEMIGVQGVMHEARPADPHGPTPVGIKPEWYFLPVYEYLRLMPTELLGISGKTLGVLSQGPLALLIVLLPFWYRRHAHERPGWRYRLAVTLCLVVFLGLLVLGGWPEAHDGHGGQRVAFTEYLRDHAMMFVTIIASVIVFYILIAHERRAIRRVLDDQDAVAPRGKEDEQ